MSELREDLGRALAAVDAGQPPVAAAMRAGRRIRARRRGGLLAAAAVIAAAAVYPTLALSGALRGPLPAQPRPAPDPVVTDHPGGTAGPGGLVSRDGVIATGRIGRWTWRAVLSPLGPDGKASGGPEFTVSVATRPGAAAPLAPRYYDMLPSPDGKPAEIVSAGGGLNTVAGIGAVSRDVTYLVLRFADGQRLTLTPVSWHGTRYVAWAALSRMPVAEVVAHFTARVGGGTASTIPYVDRLGFPYFGLWQRPGEPAPPRATRVISGTLDGRAWSVTVAEGPWGTCIDATVGPATSGGCWLRMALAATAIRGDRGGPYTSTPHPVYGTAAANVAYLRVRLSDGRTVRLTPAAVGNERVWAFAVAKGVAVRGWTAYSAAGVPVGTGR